MAYSNLSVLFWHLKTWPKCPFPKIPSLVNSLSSQETCWTGWFFWNWMNYCYNVLELSPAPERFACNSAPCAAFCPWPVVDPFPYWNWFILKLLYYGRLYPFLYPWLPSVSRELEIILYSFIEVFVPEIYEFLLKIPWLLCTGVFGPPLLFQSDKTLLIFGIPMPWFAIPPFICELLTLD